MGLKHRLRRLAREAEEGGVLLRMQDGSVRVFEEMECWKALFLAHVDLLKGESYESEILDAVRNATPESRRAFEARVGPITFTTNIIASEVDGGWVETYTLLEDGSVEKVFHEGGSEGAKRALQEARQEAAGGRPWP